MSTRSVSSLVVYLLIHLNSGGVHSAFCMQCEFGGPDGTNPENIVMMIIIATVTPAAATPVASPPQVVAAAPPPSPVTSATPTTTTTTAVSEPVVRGVG